ncbi:MAG: alpha/beta fold hydrolase [Leptospirales bacterium]
MRGIEVPFLMDDGLPNTLECWGDRGPVVLCVHGITSSRRSWERFAGPFSSTHRVYAFDQRGHGDLAAVEGPMTLEQSCADLAAAARVIGAPVDLLLGHSWGGAVVLLGATRISARSVVALDPVIRVRAGTFFQDYVEDLRELLSLQGEERIAGIRVMYAQADPVDQNAKVHAMRAMSISAIEKIGSENGADSGDWDLREILAGLRIPVLVIEAGHDSVIKPGDLEKSDLPGSSVIIRSVPEAGHNIHRSHLGEVVAMIREFEKLVPPMI